MQDENENFTKKDPKPKPDGPPLIPEVNPVCPYCGTSPARVMASPFKMGPVVLSTVFCASCKKILAIFPIGMDEPLVQQATNSQLVSLN
jgi:hypothetical protein